MIGDEITQMALEAGAKYYSKTPMRAVTGMSFSFEQIEHFANLIADHVREEDAKVCDSIYESAPTSHRAMCDDAKLCAAEIRAMKGKGK